ncbi:MAG: DUF488 domain-containing protein [Candidatus Bathyarchaeia archaeon]
MEVYSIGHSSRTLEDFLNLLEEFQIRLLVDIRRFPRSRWPWFRGDELRGALARRSIRYEYLGHLLGGFRKGGYRSYMATEDFRRGVERLLELARGQRTVVMCTERIVFRCHRRYLSNYLQQLGVRVIHIISHGESLELNYIPEPRRK